MSRKSLFGETRCALELFNGISNRVLNRRRDDFLNGAGVLRHRCVRFGSLDRRSCDRCRSCGWRVLESREVFAGEHHGNEIAGRRAASGFALGLIGAVRCVLGMRQVTAEAGTSARASTAAIASATASATTAPETAAIIAPAAFEAARRTTVVARSRVLLRRTGRRRLRLRARLRVFYADGFAGQGFGNGGRRLNVSRLERGGMPGGIGSENLAALVLHFVFFILDGGNHVVEVFDFLEEIADVEEGVAIEADVHKGRLHAGKHASDFSFVDAAD